MLKKASAIVIILCLTFCLAGCSLLDAFTLYDSEKDSHNEQKYTSSKTPTPTPTSKSSVTPTPTPTKAPTPTPTVTPTPTQKTATDTYGPGKSYLKLSAPSDKMAAYRLIRCDGADTEQFYIKLNPGESRTMEFPCGKYVLKCAEGKTWISDSEAFGSAGTYSTTNEFTFSSNMEYYISSGTKSDFKGDSSSGFTK